MDTSDGTSFPGIAIVPKSFTPRREPSPSRGVTMAGVFSNH
jgi:hypothetical protein